MEIRVLVFSPDSSATVILAISGSSHWLFAVRITAASLTRIGYRMGFSDAVARWSYTASFLYVWWFKEDKIHLTISYIANMWKLCLRRRKLSPHCRLMCSTLGKRSDTVHLSAFTRVLRVIRCFIKFDLFPLLYTQIFKHSVHVAVLESATVWEVKPHFLGF